MAAHDISPNFVEVSYISSYAKHKMRIASVPIDAVSGGGTVDPATWKFRLRGLGVPVSVPSAMADFFDLIKTQFPATTHIVGYTLYSKLDADHPAVPIAITDVDVAGTCVVPTGWSTKATQLTFSWRTETFGKQRLVMLDVPMGQTMKVKSLSLYPDWQAINDYVTDDSSWLSGYDGGRPVSFAGASYTINDRLERAYNR